ncbi:MAG: imidazole glycerol phosphate synthase subunit HisF [Cryomorphaceae bacterium MED-G14]|nr:MAG: imidazole glycerol phosphate synthase subunit HisF [Cryomorphaceae bacterium MED-G14]|tara:strand:- start:13067 stop:13822 length:756 start_codon:yes stop_codon:yes gene_type:complete
MVAKRIIPCLDIDNNRTVKGINFLNLIDAGDPVELAKLYSNQGADELVFLDITATKDKRKTLSNLALKISKNINIPFTVGGGISSIDDVSSMLFSGADKISINTQAYRTPDLINKVSSRYGSQCVVVAIDAKYINGSWYVYLVGGREKTNTKLIDWAVEVQERGAGEILFTSMNNDGTKNGFANEILSNLSEKLTIPIIASGGAGKVQDFVDVFKIGNADAALAASVFHFKEIEIKNLKEELIKNNIKVRL